MYWYLFVVLFCTSRCFQVKQEIQHLETSIKESVFETHEIREAKSSGFFSWTLFGGGWAERSFRLQGDWFSKYTLEGSHFSGNPDVDKGKGTIVANFISSHGHDLRVDVKTYRPEKDLPGSKQRVKVGRSTLFSTPFFVFLKDRTSGVPKNCFSKSNRANRGWG